VEQNKIDTQAQEAMQKALQKYLQDKNSVEEFYPCMQELTAWLKEKAKS
jgi:hypothetical protein